MNLLLRPFVGSPGPLGTDAPGIRELRAVRWLCWGCALPFAWFAMAHPGAPLACAERLAAPDLAGLLLSLAWAPIVEETVLRAGLQEPLTRAARGALRGSGEWAQAVSVLLVALAFAAWHLPGGPGDSFARLGAWLVPGVALAVFHALERRLHRTIALHAWFNASALWACGTSY